MYHELRNHVSPVQIFLGIRKFKDWIPGRARNDTDENLILGKNEFRLFEHSLIGAYLEFA